VLLCFISTDAGGVWGTEGCLRVTASKLFPPLPGLSPGRALDAPVMDIVSES